MRKLRTQTGETLVETLAAILVVALVFLFLATAIITASRVNAGVRDTDVLGHTGGRRSHGRVCGGGRRLHRPQRLPLLRISGERRMTACAWRKNAEAAGALP